MKRVPLPTRGQRLVVRIEALDDEGRGRALLEPDSDDDTRVDVAVRGAFPGDLVECSVERSFPARRLVTSRMLRCLEEGGVRVRRTCPHPPPCVGCPLDGLDPGAQLALKRERVLRALDDVGLSNLEVEDVLAAPSLTGYRQKGKLVAGGRSGALKLGLYAPHSHFVVDASRCATHHPSLLPAIAALKDALDSSGIEPATHDPLGLKAVILRASAHGPGAVIVVGAPLPDDAWLRARDLVDTGLLFSVAERIDNARGNSLVGGVIARSAGPALLAPLTGGPEVPVDAFCQADADQAERLYSLVAAFATEGGPRVLDAYAGTGGFARAVLSASPHAAVTAVESSPFSTAALSSLGCAVYASDVETALRSLPVHGFDTVIADPPRKGLLSDAEGLAALAPARFALVSCDPDAMARDVGSLCERGYRVRQIIPVDLFAGTPEVEVVTLLERTTAAG
ncbi:MAG: class I SAM-dependent RNA methyltransferase [Myxococcota bacterium]